MVVIKKIYLSSSFNTQNVTNMMFMFNDCNDLNLLLNNLNLPSSFNTQNVTSMMQMFRNCIFVQNMFSIFIKFSVLNFDKSKFFKFIQPVSIHFISFTFLVLKIIKIIFIIFFTSCKYF